MEALSRKQFDVLEQFAIYNSSLSQRKLSELTNHSLGSVNNVIKELSEQKLIDDNGITKKGLDVLEQYRVKKAVFFAAGFGSRLVPITLNTPKPLVRVNGKRIIDGLLDAVIAAGIEDITIVRGYLSEQFDQLLYKYPMIKFIDNTLYNEANNISSSLLSKDLLSNAYVFEADLLIYNPKIIKKYQYSSNFLAIKKDVTDDWCFETKDGIIVEEKIGGTNCYQMVGISYWSQEDGKKLSKDIEQAFNMPGGKELYWEQVPLVKFKDNYKVGIRECNDRDVVEIDTFNELKQIDKIYNV